MAKQTFKRIDDKELLQHLEDLASRKILMIEDEFKLNYRIVEQQNKIKKLSDKLNAENKKLAEMLQSEVKKNEAMLKKNEIFLKRYLKFRNKNYDK